ncbi:glycosyltransferase [Luteimonas sp. 8-5]|uniref:glycosyltransferase n=1 Tax=Luteimonas sp. 8-5 TaxID=3039387 RepID=UPI00243732B7|nr:glycosyltransferase [Luteimonas sp. 8-5]MDG6348295.1 glycosyltransferase [Luteimonas sp. 8-5]
MRIAIVTYNWPPRNAIGTHRPYAWAKYWARLGVEVTVLTARKQAFDEPLDLQLPVLPGVDVQEVESGGSASVFSSSSAGRIAAMMKRVKRGLRSRLGLVLDPRDAWARAAATQGAAIADRVDAVVSTFGPRSSHIIAAQMKRHRPGLLWVADYRDLWSNNHLAGYSSRAFDRERALEARTVGSGADVITTVSRELADQQREYLGKPVWVIPNGFDGEIAPPAGRLQERRTLRIVYTGMIYPGARDPTPLLKALRELLDEGRIDGNSLGVDFYGPAEPWLERLVASFDLGPLVRIRGRVSRAESLASQANADLLLLLESGSPEAAGVLTGKLFEYLAVNRPILSLGTRRGFAISRILEECGSGICVEGDVSLVKQIILGVLAGEPISWFSPNMEAIARYSRKEQAGCLLELIRGRLVGSREADEVEVP